MIVNLDNQMPGVPLVSVIIICWEGNAHLLRRAVLSLRQQTFENFEVLCAYDGCLADNEADSQLLDDAFHGCNFPARVFDLGTHTGFHTVPRNRITPLALGSYIVNMDGDNEFDPEHLELLLKAIRTPDEFGQRPDFVYSRRRYVKDVTCKKEVFEGESPLVEWNIGRLALGHGAKYNFLDTGDLMIPMSVLHTLAAQSGEIWNCNIRRYPDYDIAKRMAKCGMVGRAVDATTNVYHWTGGNIQLVEPENNEVIALPESWYEQVIASGNTLNSICGKGE
jgi:glycosyltransferase involved in cell wall biosynthesis